MKPLKIVIADDEAVIRMDLKEILREAGHEVVGETANGRRAVAIVREMHPDLVIMDIKMGQKLIKAEFTLNDREKFDYQLLIGRNIINGRYIIDPTLQNTLH